MDNFRLLSDQPLKSEVSFESAKFGHKEIAETLTAIVSNCPTPFTIGLFGRWGSGKSTISNMLKKAMVERKFGFVLFDVWKHESDALRRTFLKESVNQLKKQNSLGDDFNLKDRLESKVTRRIEGELAIKGFFKKHWKILLGILLSAVALGIVIFGLLGAQYAKSYATIALSILTGGGVVSVIIAKAMNHLLRSETITEQIDRFEDPHEFEGEFERMLSKLISNRMLVILDNLDRVTHEKAIEILATVKTFLETEDVKDKGAVFLIPCDDRAIKEHLRNVYYKLSNKMGDASNEDEFLRKFFNATLRIPEFYPTELESYARELLDQTGVQDLRESAVAWLVTKAYRQNPRQIKQFINQLIGMYILVKERINRKSLPPDFLKGNIARLTKFLILYNKFSEEMENLRIGKKWDLERVTFEVEVAGNSGSSEFNRFLMETKHIAINDLNIFFTLRRSELETELPGYDEFATALQDNRMDEVTSYLRSLGEPFSKRAALSQAIKKLLEETNLPDTRISIINCSLTAMNRIKEKLEDEVYFEIVNALSDLKQYLHIIEPKAVFEQILKPYPKYRYDLTKTYVELLAQERDDTKLPIKFVESLLIEITNNVEWFSRDIEKLSSIVEVKYYDQPQVIRIFLINEQTQKAFKIEKLLRKLVLALSTRDLEIGKSFEEKLELLTMVVPDVFDKDLVNHTLLQMTTLLGDENKKPPDPSRIEIKKRLSNSIASVLEIHQASFLEKGDQDLRGQLIQAIINGINQIGDWGQRSVYIEPLILSSALGSGLSGQAINIVKKFIANAPYEGLIDAFGGRNEEEWRMVIMDSNYAENFKQRSLGEQKIFDHLYSYLSEKQKTDWVVALLESDPLRGMQKVEALGSKVTGAESVVKKLLEISERVEINSRLKVYEICDKLNFAHKEELLERACEDTKRYTKALDGANQMFGFTLSTKISSFSDVHRRDIARATIDWLISLTAGQVFQPASIRTVLQMWPLLSGQSIIQRNFIEYTFRLLIETRNIEAIKLGIEVLTKTNPNYNDFPKYYDDLKYRVETEQDSTLKEGLIRGIKELRKSARDDGEFWKWADSVEEKAQGVH